MTRYGIAARHCTGYMLLVGYAPHKSRPGLLAVVQDHTPEIIAVFGTSESNEIITETQPPHCCGMAFLKFRLDSRIARLVYRKPGG